MSAPEQKTDANLAIDYIYSHAPIYANAQANHDRLAEYRKSKKSLLMLASGESSAVMREAEAYAHAEYLDLLDEIKLAQVEAITLKLQIDAAKLRVEVYRTESANNRSIERATQ
jgi:hypothetical protein